MEQKTGTAVPRARRIVTVSWTGWSDSCEAALYRIADGRFVRFRVDGKTELSQSFNEKRWQEERPWRVLAAFLASESNARCPGLYISGISVKGATGLEAGLLLLAAADTNEDGDGRSVLDAFEGLPKQVLETIWREEGPWLKDGYFTAAPIFDAIQEFWSLASEAGHDTIADCASNFGIPLEGNVLRFALDALRAEQAEEEAGLNDDLEESDEDDEIEYIENVPVTEAQPPSAPAGNPPTTTAVPKKGSVRLDLYGHGDLAPTRETQPEGAALVASASVSYEGIGGTETYWLHPAADSAKAYELWFAFDILPGRVACCGILEPYETISASSAADVLLRALWHARHPPAVSLAGFTRAGLLSTAQLEEIHSGLLKAYTPPEPTRTGHTGKGDLFYDSGALRYRGGLRGGLPHGKGVGYWENGVVWCDGSFRKGEPHGECRIFFPNGTLRYVGRMVDGLPKGRGTEYYDNGRIWFDGIFGKQRNYYGYGARIWVRGRKFDRDGNLVHEGRFTDNGKHSTPLEEEE